ncbi:PH domain-containing protein [Streptomyces sp. P1-3]|uniref:PH domain-containing protein n=1 Tax=Streptomyces sp. P1-3 TaxID=3421658 RepID=UPI003D36677A
MTSPDDDHSSSAPREPEPPEEPQYADRVFRSSGGIVGGVLLLALGAWLGGDALVRGEGRTPWLALAGLLCLVPVVVAFTLRPAVFAGADRLRVRNPFRTITLPWSCVEGVRAGYSSEVLAGGATYQLWAIPVSLRQRKRAARQQSRAAAEDPFGRTSAHTRGGDVELRAPADQIIDDLRELAEDNASREAAQGEPEVRWAFEVLAPAVAGAVLLAVLFLVG